MSVLNCCSIVCQLLVKIFCKMSVLNYCPIVCQLSVKIFCKMSFPNYCPIVCQLSVKMFCKMSVPNCCPIFCQQSVKIFCKMLFPNYCSIVCQLSVKIFCQISVPIYWSFINYELRSFVSCQSKIQWTIFRLSYFVFLVATRVLNHPKQVINGSRIDVQSYESWLANKKVNNFIISLLRLIVHKKD